MRPLPPFSETFPAAFPAALPAAVVLAVAGIAISVLLGGCRMDHLLDPSTPEGDRTAGRPIALLASPGAIVDTVPAGTDEVRRHTLSISVDGADAAGWFAVRRRGSAWIGLDPESGTAPQDLTVSLEGESLGEGSHADTVRVEPESGSAEAARVPVTLVVLPPGGGGGDDGEPDPPSAPGDPGQFESDETTPVPVGGTTDGTTIVVKATVQDPDPDARVRIEVEAQPIGSPFLGLGTRESTSVAAGNVASIRVDGLLPLTAYHWRIRAMDETGRESPWTSFGNNGELEADFRTP